MRIRVLSDLHREFGHVPLPEVAADVVVLAGDIDRGTRGVTWARMAFPGVPVLYVAGNHEHYEEQIGRLHEKLREVHILKRERRTGLSDVRPRDLGSLLPPCTKRENDCIDCTFVGREYCSFGHVQF